MIRSQCDCCSTIWKSIVIFIYFLTEKLYRSFEVLKIANYRVVFKMCFNCRSNIAFVFQAWNTPISSFVVRQTDSVSTSTANGAKNIKI